MHEHRSGDFHVKPVGKRGGIELIGLEGAEQGEAVGHGALWVVFGSALVLAVALSLTLLGMTEALASYLPFFPASGEKPAQERTVIAVPASAPVPAPAAAKSTGGAEKRVMRDDIDPQLLPIFLEEAQELVPAIGSDLRDWKAAPGDERVQQSLQRALHTLKGSARMAGAIRLGELTHLMESAIESALAANEFPPALFDDLERKRGLITLLDEARTSAAVKIFIGAENPLFSLSGSSVVAAPYRDKKQRIVGALGVIGPTRLNYARVIPLVDYTARVVGRILDGDGA